MRKPLYNVRFRQHVIKQTYLGAIVSLNISNDKFWRDIDNSLKSVFDKWKDTILMLLIVFFRALMFCMLVLIAGLIGLTMFKP